MPDLVMHDTYFVWSWVNSILAHTRRTLAFETRSAALECDLGHFSPELIVEKH
jgi:hypothetical protein